LLQNDLAHAMGEAGHFLLIRAAADPGHQPGQLATGNTETAGGSPLPDGRF
jgi:hypothetical protein